MDDDSMSRSRGQVSVAANSSSQDIGCITDSLASFTDLAHRPRLLGEEMIWTINALGCASDARIVETRKNSDLPQTPEQSVQLPLGIDRDKVLPIVRVMPNA